ncbi:hypothetical protein CYY_002671 [Polysphondylium violaceum]|uniref:Cytochrome b5 heme-binding domain-containing protein n=1 Tax=Polysphondylium violaceum TaxID=133409 RepID=A0A8J4PY28_9MYCE|nr:hypothetical protein CYY_002671 [Polysphondylium violaceum]
MGKGSGAPLTSRKVYPPVMYGKINKLIRKSPKPLPSTVSLDDIIKSLPKEVFEKSMFKSTCSLILTIFFIACSIVFLSKVPSYLYPIGWMLMGASVTGLMVIGNDCTHKSFSKSSIVNSIVGTIVMLPLLYPFQSYKISEKNMTNEHFVEINAQVARKNPVRQWATGKFFWILSIINWAEKYFSVKNLVDRKEKIKAVASIVGVYVFGFIFFPIMVKFFGISGFLNYWLAPWLILHFLLSTASLLPSIPFLEELQQLNQTEKTNYLVHITYPKWFEFIVKDINFALPRHIALSIPHYNLRKAYESFKKNWGEYIYECTFETELLKELLNRSQTFSNEIFSPFDTTPFVPSSKVAQDIQIDTSSRSTIDFLKNINWLHVFILGGTPVLGALGAFYFKVPLIKPTFIWSVIYYYATGIGITLLYHRALSHKSFTPSNPLKVVFLFLAAGAVQGSARWWCRDHRAHHRYTDTDKDPYSAHFGFWWSHLGWLLVKQNPDKIGRANIDDLNQDEWIRWQHRHYIKIALFMAVVFPTLVAGLLWGDWMGGYLYAGIIRLVAVHHSTFMVNSLAHYLGETPFDDNHTPKDSVITALLTFGEGYHNFHHEFPQDYRNAIKFYQYDPTKWLINLFYYCGLLTDLKTFSNNEIQKGMIQMVQKRIDSRKGSVFWGAKREELPSMDKEEFDSLVKQGQKLIIINDFVHDVKDFINDHPGGTGYINMGIGKDATEMFHGAVYGHSNAGKNLLCQFRIANFINDKKEN